MPLAQPLFPGQYINDGNTYYIGTSTPLKVDGTMSLTRADRHCWRYKVLKWENNQWITPNPPTIDILVTTSSEEWGRLPEGHATRPADPGDNVLQSIRGFIQLGGKRRKSTKKRDSKKRRSKSKRRKNSKRKTKRRRRSTKRK